MLLIDVAAASSLSFASASIGDSVNDVESFITSFVPSPVDALEGEGEGE